MVSVLDDTRIGVYRVTSAGWALTRTLRPDSRLPFVFHPKLWFHREEPLLTFMMATETDGRVQNRRGVAEVWVTSLTEEPPRYRRVNDPSVERIKDKIYADGKIDSLDGITVQFEDWWFNVRPSNTEPLLGLVLEGRTRDVMDEKRAVTISFLTLAFDQLLHVFTMLDKSSGFFNNAVGEVALI